MSIQIYRPTLLILTYLLLHGCTTPDEIKQSKKVSDDLYQQGKFASNQIIQDNFSLHYVAGGSKSDSALIFVHGTPGDWKVFGPQLADKTLSKHFELYSVDRPGWGGSAFKNGGVEKSLTEQAALISELLKKIKAEGKNITVIGHSLGGTLVPILAMQYPQYVDKVIVIAGDLSSDLLKTHWYNELASWTVVHYFIPKELCNANAEVLALKTNLEKISHQWASLDKPMLVVQGEHDGLVDPKNASFAENLNTNSKIQVVRFDKANHLVHLTHSAKINKLIKQFGLTDKK